MSFEFCRNKKLRRYVSRANILFESDRDRVEGIGFISGNQFIWKTETVAARKIGSKIDSGSARKEKHQIQNVQLPESP